MANEKRVYSASDVQPLALYAKQVASSQNAFPVLVDSEGKLLVAGTSNIIVVTGGLVPKGAYSADTDYAVGDSVDYLGSSYVMFVDAAAGTLPTDTTKWQVLASKGDTGEKGDKGDKGDTGSVESNDGVMNYFYGSPVEGSWRQIVVGDNFCSQRYEGGEWNTKTEATP